ncbi:MAG: transposase [Candidatus Limiplasma sp.]|nr:transposase [Candidatus Limiplasma sp.]
MQEFLKAFTGFLHVDGYDGYHKLPSGIAIVGCWAYLRRKFDEAMKSPAKEDQPPSLASEGLAWCNRQFRLEKQFISPPRKSAVKNANVQP